VKDLIVIEQPPVLPEEWDYQVSASKVKQIIYKWGSLTIELATELWIARELLSVNASQRERLPSGTFVPVDKTWDTYCQEIGSSRRVINRWLARWFEPEQLPSPLTPPLPPGVFNVIAIDPPWPYGTVYNADTRRVASPYPEMGLDELGALNIPSADNCILWLWTTNAFMHDAYHLLEVWKFEPKTILTWFKGEDPEHIKTGVGYWLRGQTEHCILAVKGEPQITHKAQGTALFAKATTHSTKPDEFYELVEALCGKATEQTYLEMFARKPRENWTVWGLDV